jgi:hypothetical protein
VLLAALNVLALIVLGALPIIGFKIIAACWLGTNLTIATVMPWPLSASAKSGWSDAMMAVLCATLFAMHGELVCSAPIPAEQAAGQPCDPHAMRQDRPGDASPHV